PPSRTGIHTQGSRTQPLFFPRFGALAGARISAILPPPPSPQTASNIMPLNADRLRRTIATLQRAIDEIR
ncbi:MAG: hypothetical protein IJS87_04590, partial [Rhodocyclaceae bacterium]|nr:hypothetical protein [Rhodocyclaceae bacterium]